MLITINNLLLQTGTHTSMHCTIIAVLILLLSFVFTGQQGWSIRHVRKVGSLSIHARINFGHSFVTEILSVKANKFSTGNLSAIILL